MKVIDLLQRIANKKDIPKVVKILDNTLLPDFRILEWNEDLELYEHIDRTEFNCVLDKYHLDIEVDIIEEPPKEDKKIRHISNDYAYVFDEQIQQDSLKYIADKINEIIDRLNGE